MTLLDVNGLVKRYGDRTVVNNVSFHVDEGEIVEQNETGRPVLVGTTSIAKSETISKMLGKRGVKHVVLNAKFHERESAIVAQAGRKGSVTIATNMAGRGTDILLGGNSEYMSRQQALAEEVRAGLDLPPLANTAMDGYAVRAADTAGATDYLSKPMRLKALLELVEHYLGKDE